MAMYTQNLVLVSVEKGKAHWPVRLAKPMSFKFNKIPFLKKVKIETYEKWYLVLISVLFMQTHAYTCEHTSTSKYIHYTWIAHYSHIQHRMYKMDQKTKANEYKYPACLDKLPIIHRLLYKNSCFTSIPPQFMRPCC